MMYMSSEEKSEYMKSISELDLEHTCERCYENVNKIIKLFDEHANVKVYLGYDDEQRVHHIMRVEKVER